MSKHLKRTAVLFAALLATSPLKAEGEAPTRDTVVATVNGVEITVGHMIVARNGLPEQYRQLPDELLYKALLDQLVNQTVLEQSYKAETPARVRMSLENQRRTLVAAEAIEVLVAEKVSEAAVRKAYDAKYSEAAPEKEFNASHILVETEDEAKALVAELAGGADFAELAKANSTGPSGPNGGNLGWFSKGMMVAPFSEAVALLDDGAVSEPVKTEFGWHVIKLVESRLAAAPAFEDVQETLKQELYTKVVEDEIERLKKLGTVEMVDPASIDPTVLHDQNLLGE